MGREGKVEPPVVENNILATGCVANWLAPSLLYAHVHACVLAVKRNGHVCCLRSRERLCKCAFKCHFSAFLGPSKLHGWQSRFSNSIKQLELKNLNCRFK